MRNGDYYYAFSLTIGILTTRLVLTSPEQNAADTLLFIHILLASTLCIWLHGIKIFLYLPPISVQEWRFSIGRRPRPLKCIWTDGLCRGLFVAFSIVAMISGYRAIAELQNLPVTVLLMQADSLLLELFFAAFGLIWTQSTSQRSWIDLRFEHIWLAYQVWSVMGICWLCWSHSKNHAAGVVLAVVSSFATGMATLLYHWITQEVRNGQDNDLRLHAFNATVLVVEAVMVIVVSKPDLTGFLDLTNTFRVLLIISFLSCGVAINAAGGVAGSLRSTSGFLRMHWTVVPVSVVWSAVLAICEMAASKSSEVPWGELVLCVAITVGRNPIEHGYAALPPMINRFSIGSRPR